MKLLTIQSATQELLADTLELDRLCFDGIWTEAAYQREIDSPNSSLFVLSTPKLKNNYSELQLIGMGCLWAILDEAHITLLGIHPDYRGQKLGQFLLCNLLQNAVDRGLKRATLEVSEKNISAISLYKKFGFAVAGKRRNYYPKTGEDALVLWLKGLEQPRFRAELHSWWQKTSTALKYHRWKIVENK